MIERLEPWLDDGNIVLVAQDKGFRVHRSILGSYSEVFKDMFAIPHSDDVIDGCPVVHLQDSSGDVQIILKALYDRSCLFFRDEPMPFVVLSAFLRLGKKYAIRQLFKEAVHRLSPDVPLLELVSKISDTEETTLFPLISGADPYNFMIMNIANEIGHLSTVAIAVYYCCVTIASLENVALQKVRESFPSFSPDIYARATAFLLRVPPDSILSIRSAEAFLQLGETCGIVLFPCACSARKMHRESMMR